MADQYFDVEPNSPLVTRTVTLRLDQRSVELTTATGVFSAQRVDVGTELLIRYAPVPPATGNLLDLGCGYGPLAVSLGLRSPAAQVSAVDVNRRALDLTRDNAARLGASNVAVYQPDQVPGYLSFEAIYSNPPVKVGKGTLHNLLETWLPRLTPQGRAYLVVKQSLGSDSLHNWLNDQGWPTERLKSKSGYRILKVAPSSRQHLNVQNNNIPDTGPT